LNSEPQRYGLIGYPLLQSASAAYFAKKFEREGLAGYSYSLFPLLSVDEVRPLIAGTPGLQGFNVTIPFKQSIIPLLDKLDAAARDIGAVNTVVVRNSGKAFELTGYNTDAEGFRKSLSPGFSHTHALILGTGGSSKAVAYSLKKMGLEFLFVSRTKTADDIISYTDIGSDILKRYTFIVNCTPAGMYYCPETLPPFPVSLLNTRHEVYDLIYNPPMTKLLQMAAKTGAGTRNGRKMLEMQADLAFEIWMKAE